MTKKSLCNEEDFNEFYKTNIQFVTNFSSYKSNDKDTALDLIQEAFLKMWEKCSEISYEKAKSYLFTSVNNLFLNKLKHEKVVLNYAKNAPYLDINNQSPEYLLEEEEFKTKLKNAIENLTEAEREVFLMNRIDGKKYREIAELLNISQKAVEKRMSSALKKLRSKIELL
ncbi:RNA polymerase sigma factor [Tenacibaculum singaporense]|uniref:Sigma-70 family RNA polymerase sigma factor n=1 Tax=Tenacibaculum singaporense TaxID=2358479 RepID=A0A3Q8RLC1_9FLAO|nr:sigma-70 family RNA polymerase sigma factor [Tenacibaculum singaporense]AZJ34207.1 sigma-70 family RNA polymerase sigma factor [Tenacibaculum singaporense]RSC95563.1 sigma-70 family RNA polymerase sigma factor [Tenacibaculum singaporense]